jgi:hypothetical protein
MNALMALALSALALAAPPTPESCPPASCAPAGTASGQALAVPSEHYARLARLDPAAARARLAAHQGSVRQALESPS